MCIYFTVLRMWGAPFICDLMSPYSWENLTHFLKFIYYLSPFSLFFIPENSVRYWADLFVPDVSYYLFLIFLPLYVAFELSVRFLDLSPNSLLLFRVYLVHCSMCTFIEALNFFFNWAYLYIKNVLTFIF